jgi:hypothetical protein
VGDHPVAAFVLGFEEREVGATGHHLELLARLRATTPKLAV